MMGGTTFPDGGPHPISEETAMAIMAAAQGGANLDSLVARIEDLERRLTEAEAEISALRMPGLIEGVAKGRMSINDARRRLGMVPFEEPEFDLPRGFRNPPLQPEEGLVIGE
jgi:hypothetical protein